MIRLRLAALLALAALPALAAPAPTFPAGQTPMWVVPSVLSTDGSQYVALQMGGSYALPVTMSGVTVTLGAGAAVIGGVTQSGAWTQTVQVPASAGTSAGCTVGTSSAQCLAGSLVTRHLQIQNTSAAASIACTWGATAALNASGSFMLAPGQPASWGVGTGWVPTNALTCIASAASTPLYVEYN